MDVGGLLFGGLEIIMREAALFAATGYLVLGASDAAVDFLWLAVRLRAGRSEEPVETGGGRRFAMFIPAWDEAAVIGPMLRSTVAALGTRDVRLYVGTYPNDPRSLAAVRSVEDARIRSVVVAAPGPTTKADCLNALWEALRRDQEAEGLVFHGVILHDAEDVVHRGEIDLFDRCIGRFDLVQLPVLPLIDPESRLVGGHYADEFAEAHGKELVVRQAIGAALPSAGVGCAFSMRALERIAECSGGLPFDAESLTEDYELGLRIAEAGGRGIFLRRRDGRRELIATREYFPATLRAAVAQKSRWMTGIALSGWDRLGWRGGLAERWMRLRDRQALLAALLLFAGYLAMALWLALKLREGLGGPAPAPLAPALSFLLRVNLSLLGWRLAVRCAFVTRAYGWAEGLRSIPRAAVGNLVAMLAAAAALSRYRAIRRTGRARWDKTAHVFPSAAAPR